MMKKTKIRVAIGAGAALAVTAGALATTAYATPSQGRGARTQLISAQVATRLTTARPLATPQSGNGDSDPRGVAVVPTSVGNLVRGDVLVSDFKGRDNRPGTGSTLIEVNPVTGRQIVFARLTQRSLPSTCPGGIGLTAAIAVLQDGWVVVGSAPAANGTPASLKSGCLIVLNSLGKPRAVITGHGINGPWDMTAVDGGNTVELFVSNVLNGTVAGRGRQVDGGTVVRLRLAVSRQHFFLQTAVIVASGLPEMTSPTSLVIGPTGLAVLRGTLYLADTLGNRIASVPFAETRHTSDRLGGTLAEGGLLRAPLGLAALSTGVLLVTNGDNADIVAVTTQGRMALVKTVTTAVITTTPTLTPTATVSVRPSTSPSVFTTPTATPTTTGLATGPTPTTSPTVRPSVTASPTSLLPTTTAPIPTATTTVTPGAGALFGIATAPNIRTAFFTDAATNTLDALAPLL